MVDMGYLEREISKAINGSTGIKSVELVMQMMRKFIPKPFSNEEFQAAITNLVEMGEISELEYVVPATGYRLKSIYFPKGTRIILRNKQVKNIIELTEETEEKENETR